MRVPPRSQMLVALLALAAYIGVGLHAPLHQLRHESGRGCEHGGSGPATHSHAVPGDDAHAHAHAHGHDAPANPEDPRVPPPPAEDCPYCLLARDERAPLPTEPIGVPLVAVPGEFQLPRAESIPLPEPLSSAQPRAPPARA